MHTARVTDVYWPKQGEAKDRSKAGRGPQSRAESIRYRTADRLGVRAGRMVRTGETKKQNLRKQRDRKTLVIPYKTRQSGKRQTENTGINTLGIMRKMGDKHKTGETNQGVILSPHDT
jgi:hypothetical protein